MPYWVYSLVLVLVLGGCASFRSYDQELYQTLDRASTGNVEGAIQLLESNNKSADKDLLYYLELGMLQRLGTRYDESQKTWSVANARIEAAGTGGLVEISNFARGVGSYVVNDKMRTYAGYDYEKVMLLTYMALNHLAMGNYDAARVAIKQTHELEARIAEQRAAQIAEVEEAAQKRGARTSFREVNGYPIQTIDNPEVQALRNGYQSALSHYLAGYVYEALGEPSLAAPGYRLANELQPGQPLLEEALGGLDQRVAAPDDGMADVLMIIGTGSAPALQSRQFMLPVQIENRLILISYSFPVLTSTSYTPLPTLMNVDGRALHGGAADQHRPHGAPPPAGRDAGHHAARHRALHGARHHAVPGAAGRPAREHPGPVPGGGHLHGRLRADGVGRRPHLACPARRGLGGARTPAPG
jgi:uncharacterized protein